MAYYLFKVDGFTREHAGDRGHVLNLAYAGYTGIDKNVGLMLSLPVVGIPVSLVRTYQGNTVTAVPVPVEVKGSSGRQPVSVSNTFSIGSMQTNPFVSGKLYYPFYDVDLWNSGSFAHQINGDSDPLLDTSDLLKSGVVSPDDVGNSESIYGTNLRFQWTIAEGEPVPNFAASGAEDSYRRLGLNPAYVDVVGWDPGAVEEIVGALLDSGCLPMDS